MTFAPQPCVPFQPVSVLSPFNSKYASWHSWVHVSSISISKSSPPMRCLQHFWLQTLLHATAACISSTSQCFSEFLLQNVFRATAACNFRFLIPRLLFDPPEPSSNAKTQCLQFFFLLARLYLVVFFFLFSSLLSSSFLFSDLVPSSCLFSDCSHLSCYICPKVGSLTSNFPSI